MKYKMPTLETNRLILKRGTFEDYKKYNNSKEYNNKRNVK